MEYETKMIITLISAAFIAAIIVSIVYGAVFYVPSEAEQLCLSHSPGEEWEVIVASEHEFGVPYTTIFCDYETVPEVDYDFCVMEFGKTENHGFILAVSTCPGGA